MDIQITTKNATGLERHLEVSVPAELVRDAEDRASKRYATSVRLPGFRPGKAPAHVVRKKFGEAIRQQALESLVQDAYKEVLERENIKPAAQPHVHEVKFEDGKALTFELHVEIRPEIELARTSGFRVRKTEAQIGDEQVREQIEQLREQRATWAPITDRPAPADMVTVMLATSNDAGDMPEGKEYRIVLGGGQAIPGIEELIMEAQIGDTIERPVRWPDDFPDEAQRGKTKTVQVSVTEAKRKTLPAVDDAFAREVGDFDSLDALRGAVREDLTRHAERESQADIRQKLIDEILGANSFDVPGSWVDQLIVGYADAYQIPEDERAKFGDEFRTMAERQVRRDLVIETIAEREKLAATEADIDERVAEVAAKRGAEPGQVYASLQKANRLREIERSITEDKVFGYLLDKNTVE